MSYGTSIKLPYGTIYFNRANIRCKSDLLDQQEEAEKDIQQVKEELKMMAAGTPKDLFPDEEDVFLKVKQEFDSNWEVLEEYFFDKVRADIVLNELDGWSWDHKDGLGETVEENLDPDKPEDWAKIASGDYYPDASLRFLESATIETLNSQLDKICEPYLYKQNLVNDKYVLFYKNRIYHTFNGLYLFSSKDSAIQHFFNSIDFNISSFTSKKFVEKNYDFMTKEILPYIIEDDTHTIADYLSTVESIKASDKDYNFEITSKLHDYADKAIRQYIMQNIVVKHITVD